MDGILAKMVIAYASKTLNGSQRCYSTTNKELPSADTAVEYYLTGRHFTVVTDHACLVWLRNLKEPEDVVFHWITLSCLHGSKIRALSVSHSLTKLYPG